MVQVSCFVLSQQKCLQLSISQHLSKKEKLLLLKKSKNDFLQQKANELKEVAKILYSVIVLFSVCEGGEEGGSHELLFHGSKTTRETLQGSCGSRRGSGSTEAGG